MFVDGISLVATVNNNTISISESTEEHTENEYAQCTRIKLKTTAKNNEEGEQQQQQLCRVSGCELPTENIRE